MIENRVYRSILQGVVAVLVLAGLILTGVRLLLTNAFVQLEYNMPGFPEDPYGMTKEQRLSYAPLALEFLLNGEPPEFLGQQTFADGSPLYNDRELRHMVDVQALTEIFLWVWSAGLILLAAVALWAWRGGWGADFRRMLSMGGLVTIVVLGTLLLLLALSFDFVFTGFHRIFFQGDSWLFLYSDTLIRLFPLRFWQDAFIFVGTFTFLGGLVLWRLLRVK